MRRALIAAGLTLCATVILAQSERGVIAGSVTDRLGHQIASAPISATNTDTRTQYTTESGGTGGYSLSLPAGKYDLSVEAAGHRYIQQGIIVSAERPLRVDVTLAIP
jgi:hypothetical protein